MKPMDITVTEVREVFSVLSEKGRREKMLNRPFYGLSLCMSGQITYIQGGSEYVSRPGTAVILPRGGNYIIRGDQTGLFPVINFECLEFLGCMIQVIPVQHERQLLNSYEQIRKIFFEGGSRMQVMSLFYDLLDKLQADGIPPVLRRAVELIRDNCGDPLLTNARLAGECGVSEVYFRKLFAGHFHCSPRQYIIGLRIQKAKQLLSEGVMTITDISQSCGFSNPYHFSRTFRSHTGQTPSDYRRTNRPGRL